MKLKEIMTRDPILLKPNCTIYDAAKIFLNSNIDGAPVVNNTDNLIGIFSKQHIYQSILNRIEPELPIATLMRKDNLIYRYEDDDIYETINSVRVGRLPILNSQLKVVGIITRDNIVKYFSQTSRDLNTDLNYLLQYSVDGLSIVDGDEIILYRNSVMKRLTGIPDDEAIGHEVKELRGRGAYGPSSYTSGIKLCKETKQSVTITYKNHLNRIITVTCTPILEKDDSIKRIIVNMRDVTEFDLIREELQEAQKLNRQYKNQLESLTQPYYKRKNIIYSSAKMQELLEYITKIASVDSTVLITGESGTGKELIADTIHYESKRNNGPLIKVNCGSIPDNLLESELFGYEPGAFTGASKEGKPGFFDLANNGTIFLDEIGEIPYNLQVKLLRVLQNKEFIRVGGNKYLKANVRVIAATNRDLLKMVHDNLFREDLYYRLNVFPVRVPPLRERTEDIPLLLNHFCMVFNNKYAMKKFLDNECIVLLSQYEWPGNVRELENIVENLIVTCPQELITPNYLPNFVNSANGINIANNISLNEMIEKVEKQIIERAYAKYKNTKEVADKLGVVPSTIIRKANRYGINPKDYK